MGAERAPRTRCVAAGSWLRAGRQARQREWQGTEAGAAAGCRQRRWHPRVLAGRALGVTEWMLLSHRRTNSAESTAPARTGEVSRGANGGGAAGAPPTTACKHTPGFLGSIFLENRSLTCPGRSFLRSPAVRSYHVISHRLLSPQTFAERPEERHRNPACPPHASSSLCRVAFPAGRPSGSPALGSRQGPLHCSPCPALPSSATCSSPRTAPVKTNHRPWISARPLTSRREQSSVRSRWFNQSCPCNKPRQKPDSRETPPGTPLPSALPEQHPVSSNCNCGHTVCSQFPNRSREPQSPSRLSRSAGGLGARAWGWCVPCPRAVGLRLHRRPGARPVCQCSQRVPRVAQKAEAGRGDKASSRFASGLCTRAHTQSEGSHLVPA